MSSFFKKSIVLICALFCIVPMQAMYLRKYMPNFFKRTAAILPIQQKRNYLINLRTYERLLPGGIVQQLHVGSDYHQEGNDNKQVTDLMTHIKSKHSDSCRVFVEDSFHNNDQHMCEPLGNKNCSNMFLHLLMKTCLKEKIKAHSVETRTFLQPMFGPNVENGILIADICVMLNECKLALQATEEKSKKYVQKAISFVDELIVRLEPHKKQTVYDFWKTQGWDGNFDSYVEMERATRASDFILDKNQIGKFLQHTMRLLTDNMALSYVCSAPEPNLYLNMGAAHIHIGSPGAESLDKNFTDLNWRLVHESNEELVRKVKETRQHGKGLLIRPGDYQVDVAKHFKTLPARGSKILTPEEWARRNGHIFS